MPSIWYRGLRYVIRRTWNLVNPRAIAWRNIKKRYPNKAIITKLGIVPTLAVLVGCSAQAAMFGWNSVFGTLLSGVNRLRGQIIYTPIATGLAVAAAYLVPLSWGAGGIMIVFVTVAFGLRTLVLHWDVHHLMVSKGMHTD